MDGWMWTTGCGLQGTDKLVPIWTRTNNQPTTQGRSFTGLLTKSTTTREKSSPRDNYVFLIHFFSLIPEYRGSLALSIQIHFECFTVNLHLSLSILFHCMSSRVSHSVCFWCSGGTWILLVLHSESIRGYLWGLSQSQSRESQM